MMITQQQRAQVSAMRKDGFTMESIVKKLELGKRKVKSILEQENLSHSDISDENWWHKAQLMKHDEAIEFLSNIIDEYVDYASRDEHPTDVFKDTILPTTLRGVRALYDAAPNWISMDQMIIAMGYDKDPEDRCSPRTIYTHMSIARRKLKPYPKWGKIDSRQGCGYRLLGCQYK